MSYATPFDRPTLELSKLAHDKALLAAFRLHLQEVVQSSTFKGSARSQQFLTYVVETALTGSLDALKERVIGLELFHRSADYDTGEDAIVRVTASDVRKRLLQHYGQVRVSSDFRIALPTGSYVPEISYEPSAVIPEVPSVEIASSQPIPEEFEEVLHAPLPVPALIHESVSELQPVPVLDSATDTASGKSATTPLWVLWVAASLIAVVCLAAGFYVRHVRAQYAPPLSLPWSVLFHPGETVELVTSDPNISEIQELTKQSVSLSDYANQKYIPGEATLTPEVRSFATMLRGDTSADVDTPIAVRIAQLAHGYPVDIHVRGARSLRLSDIQAADNLILLGSPRSEPWFEIFNNQLDFRFVYQRDINQEVLHNSHPRKGELEEYSPTARGWATGDTFAIIAFVHNVNQSGEALLLAGAAAEGTEAAGKFVTDSRSMSEALRNCGIQERGPTQHFELLLHLNTMAGTPHHVSVVACHILR